MSGTNETIIGSSSIRTLENGSGENPFKSRSTLIFLSSIFGLMYVNVLCWVSGYFSQEIALISIYLMRDIMLKVIDHQKTVETKPS